MLSGMPYILLLFSHNISLDESIGGSMFPCGRNPHIFFFFLKTVSCIIALVMI